MGKQNKKVICIRADEDKEYEQIIFVMKDLNTAQSNNSKAKINLVLEAEKIINQKMDRSNIYRNQKNAVLRSDGEITQLVIKRSSMFDIVLNICMMAGCIFLTAVLVYMSR